MKFWTAFSFSYALLATFNLSAHCQMPCGIYHDDMVYDQIDQYVETMVKGLTVLNDNKFSTAQQRNEFVRWVMNKEKMSDETAQIILSYFLQQKVKPNDPNSTKILVSAQKLLCQLTTIKQNVDINCVKDFSDEWEKFKLFFHVEGYECKMEKIKLTEWDKKREEQRNAQHQRDHEQGVPHSH